MTLACSKSREPREKKLDLIMLDSVKVKPQVLATTLSNKQKDSLEQQVYQYGSTSAYRTLYFYYLNYGDREEFLKISKFLADKYNNSTAQYSVYVETLYLNKDSKCQEISILCLPITKRQVALLYLKMAVENKNNRAVSEYKTLKQRNIIQ